MMLLWIELDTYINPIIIPRTTSTISMIPKTIITVFPAESFFIWKLIKVASVPKIIPAINQPATKNIIPRIILILSDLASASA